MRSSLNAVTSLILPSERVLIFLKPLWKSLALFEIRPLSSDSTFPGQEVPVVLLVLYSLFSHQSFLVLFLSSLNVRLPPSENSTLYSPSVKCKHKGKLNVKSTDKFLSLIHLLNLLEHFIIYTRYVLGCIPHFKKIIFRGEHLNSNLSQLDWTIWLRVLPFTAKIIHTPFIKYNYCPRNHYKPYTIKYRQWQ